MKHGILLFQHQLPYLSAMVNNGTLKYDHDKDGATTMVGGCEVKFRNKDFDTFIAVRYENDVLTGEEILDYDVSHLLNVRDSIID